jgi:tetratricopeptide (TPR) repeat protein
MARALAHKKLAGKKTSKIAHSAKKGKSSTASSFSRSNHAVKDKASSSAAKSKKSPQKRQEALSSAGHPAKKERIIMEVESRKPASRTGIRSAPEPPPHLLRQTKTTSAALALLEKGIGHLFKRDYKKARGEFRTLLESYPGEMDIIARARSYMQICDRDEAVQKKPAITADQLYATGVVEHNKANYDKAVSYFLQAIEKRPNADYIYYSAAASLAMKGDLTGSLKHLRKAVELKEESRFYAKNDSDFSSLQTQKEFLALVGLVQSSSSEPQ